MATIRAYTTIEQSRKLAEILPIESADMHYYNDRLALDYYKNDQEYYDKTLDRYIPAWSLAALLGILPEKYAELIKEGGMYRIIIKDSYMTCLFENPVDACVAMIEKLNELNLL